MSAPTIADLEAAGALAVSGEHGRPNRERAALLYRAHYYAWSARREHAPCGNDPYDGRPFENGVARHFTQRGALARAIGRAENAAAARVCFQLARRHANPLARTEGR
jgi:hypothetical protein